MSNERLLKLFLGKLDDDEITRLKFDWPIWSRLKQRPPLENWKTWLILGGRGAGKTRAGAEWLRGIAMADPHFPGHSGGRLALVGTNYDAIRDVMIEGESGLLAISPKAQRPKWISSRRELIWPNGVIGKLFSSADPDHLRGNQFGGAWCDAKTVWGGIIAVVTSLASLFGVSIDTAAANEIPDAMLQFISAIGGLVAIYGRLAATDLIS